jgi:hypothetical protein
MFKRTKNTLLALGLAWAGLNSLGCSDDTDETDGGTGSNTSTATGSTSATGTGSDTGSTSATGTGSDTGSTSATGTGTGSDTTTTDTTGPSCGEIACIPGDPNACGEGKKCGPYKCGDGCCTDTTRCIELSGDKQVGEDCTRDGVNGTDDCGASLYCMPADGTTAGNGPGKCEQLCNPESSDPAQCDSLGVAGGYCFNFNGGSYPACLPTCDPLNNMCTDGQGCYFAVDNYFCTNSTDSLNGADGGQGSQCDTEQGCQVGFACTPSTLFADCTTQANGVVDGCCSAYCDTTVVPTTCPSGLSCIDLPGDNPGLEKVGVCGVPK